MSFSTSCRALTLAGVPVLLASPNTNRSEPPAAIPVVLWFHGFRADALAHAAELEHCAALGFLAVGVDAVGHGVRAHHDIGERIARSSAGALPVMLDLAQQTVHELPALIGALARDHGADRTRVSAVGISMGAFLMYRAIAEGMPIRTAVTLLGSPEWPGDSSAHLALEAFRHVRLLSITAEHDVSVPPAAVARFHAALQEGFTGESTWHHHVLRGAGHLTSAEEWREAMTHTLGWLQRFG